MFCITLSLDVICSSSFIFCKKEFTTQNLFFSEHSCFAEFTDQEYQRGLTRGTNIPPIDRLDVLKNAMRRACQRIQQLQDDREAHTTEEKLWAAIGLIRHLEADKDGNLCRGFGAPCTEYDPVYDDGYDNQGDPTKDGTTYGLSYERGTYCDGLNPSNIAAEYEALDDVGNT